MLGRPPGVKSSLAALRKGRVSQELKDELEPANVGLEEPPRRPEGAQLRKAIMARGLRPKVGRARGQARLGLVRATVREGDQSPAPSLASSPYRFINPLLSECPGPVLVGAEDTGLPSRLTVLEQTDLSPDSEHLEWAKLEWGKQREEFGQRPGGQSKYLKEVESAKSRALGDGGNARLS